MKGTAELWVDNQNDLSFDAQTTMELNVKIVIPANRYTYFYRLKSTGQIIRMYHNTSGHDEISRIISL